MDQKPLLGLLSEHKPTSPQASARIHLWSLWGSHVVIPTPGKEVILSELHKGHPGIARMKGFASGGQGSQRTFNVLGMP